MYADGRIEWTTGDWSGGSDGLFGTEALAGINAGNRINSYTISGSRTTSIINIARTTNVGIPGTWIFEVGGLYINLLENIDSTSQLVVTYIAHSVSFIYVPT